MDDALTVSRIRNACREFMTHDQREITPDGQEKWWGSLDHGLYRLFLLSCAQTPVGFGVLRTEEEVWLTGGLLPDWRGKGLGTELFKNLCQEAADLSYPEVWLDAFGSNERAVRVYEKLGFVRQSEQEGVVIMKRDLEKCNGA